MALLESMTASDLLIFCVVGAVVMTAVSVGTLKMKEIASSIFHERHQDKKIMEHDMRLSHLEKKN
ncbi:hypothetical protein ACO3VM_09430 (plasmid) [Methanocaldococcus sp. 10A]